MACLCEELLGDACRHVGDAAKRRRGVLSSEKSFWHAVLCVERAVSSHAPHATCRGAASASAREHSAFRRHNFPTTPRSISRPGFPLFPPLSEKPPLSRRCQPRGLLSGSHIPRTCATWVLRCAFALGECACIVALHPHSRTSRCDPTPLTVCVALGAKPLVWPSPRAGEHFTVSLAVKVCAPALHPY